MNMPQITPEMLAELQRRAQSGELPMSGRQINVGEHLEDQKKQQFLQSNPIEDGERGM